MLEVIVFALVLVAAQMLAGFLMLRIMFSDKFVSYYAKKTMKMTQKIQEEFEENLYND